jgi:hypothetical protein
MFRDGEPPPERDFHGRDAMKLRIAFGMMSLT